MVLMPFCTQPSVLISTLLLAMVGPCQALGQPGAPAGAPAGALAGASAASERRPAMAGGGAAGGSLAAGPKPAAPPSADWNRRAASFGGHEWVTRPSRDSIMGFAFPIEIDAIPVAGGQLVKKGDVLVRGRDAEVAAALEVQRVRAANDAPVQNATSALQLAELRYNNTKNARDLGGSNQSEFDERRIAWEAAKSALLNAEMQLKEERGRVAQLERQLERYALRAPFDCVVEIVAGELGQAVDIQQPVVRVVAIDPLWIDVPTPTEETLRLGLKEGSPASVLLDVPDAGGPGAPARAGRVLYVSPVVDAAGTRRVRVEVPNPTLLPAGTRAKVRFDGESAAAPAAGAPATAPQAEARAGTGGVRP